MPRSTSSIGLASLGAALAMVAWTTDARAECFPECRSGFACKNSKCVKDAPPPDASCYPACRAGFDCRGGQCVGTAAPGPGLTPPTAGKTLVPPPGIDPTGPAPQPIDPAGAKRWKEELARREGIRQDVKFGLVVGAGYSFNELLPTSRGLKPERWGQPLILTGDGAAVSLGFGLRKNFLDVLGLAASVRVQAYFFESSDPLTVEVADRGHAYSDAGTGIRVSGDLSLRVGPFADGFPMYLGLGGIVAADIVFGTVTFTDAATHTGPISYGETHLRGGPLVEIGFVFGGAEQFTLGARIELMTSDTNDQDHSDTPETIDSKVVLLDFGWSWL